MGHYIIIFSRKSSCLQWLVFRRYQVIVWADVVYTSVSSRGICLRAIQQDMLKMPIVHLAWILWLSAIMTSCYDESNESLLNEAHSVYG